MDPHVHIGFVSLFASFLVVFVIFGTLHLLAISSNGNRLANAFMALGF